MRGDVGALGLGEPIRFAVAMDDDLNAEVDPDHENERGDDVREQEAAARLTRLFEENPTTVFYGRQLEVLFERDYFHWITNRALRALEGVVTLEPHPLAHASPTTLAWHRRYRYPRRQIAEVMELVNRYVTPEVSRAVGDRGEDLVLDGFAARNRFTCLMGVHRLEDRIQEAVAEPPVGQHSSGQGLEP